MRYRSFILSSIFLTFTSSTLANSTFFYDENVDGDIPASSPLTPVEQQLTFIGTVGHGLNTINGSYPTNPVSGSIDQDRIFVKLEEDSSIDSIDVFYTQQGIVSVDYQLHRMDLSGDTNTFAYVGATRLEPTNQGSIALFDYRLPITQPGYYMISGSQSYQVNAHMDYTIEINGTVIAPVPVNSRTLAMDTVADDRLGYDVAIHNEWVFVSAAYDDDPQNSGKVYVFKKHQDGSLTEHTVIKPSDLASNTQFGASLAVDGNTLAIGARNQTTSTFLDGSVYVYTFDAFGNFTLMQKLNAQDTDRVIGLGMDIALRGDYMVVGAERTFTNGLVYAGSAYVFKRVAGLWQQMAELVNGNPESQAQFGYSVAINEQGNRIVVGEPRASDGTQRLGNAHAYVLDNGAWVYEQQLRPGDLQTAKFYGYSVAIKDDDVIAIGAMNDNENATAAGAVYVYNRAANNWVFDDKLFATDPSNYTYGRFGASLLFENGSLWVGAETRHATGALFQHKRVNNVWVEHAVYSDPLSVSNDKFANKFSVDAGFAVVGSPYANDAGSYSGAFTLIQVQP